MEDLPDILNIFTGALSISELVALSETKSLWSEWIERELKNISDIYELPVTGSARELAISSWYSANRLLKYAVKR